MRKQLFDEGITTEMPGVYCLYCGIPLESGEEKEAGLCADHIGGENVRS